MLYVVDSSVAFKWVVPEIDTDKALRLRDDFNSGIIELIATDVFPTELAHALTRAERQGRLAKSEAADCWLDAMSTAPEISESLPLTPRAIDLSSAYRIGVYDCIYVALAETEQCQFVTADDRVVRNLQKDFPFMVSLSSMP